MERERFERLALEQLEAVYRMAFHLTKDPDLAEDLVQDVYVRAIRPHSMAGFESKGGGMRAWLFAITHNVFYSDLKRSARRPKAVGDVHGRASNGRMPDDPPPVWDRSSLDWEHVDERLKAVIDSLRPEYREVLLLWGVDGLKYREMAAILDVPIGTVMSRLHRARKLAAEGLVGREFGSSDEGGLVADPGEFDDGAEDS